jgi:glycosyltransferase involved in cell wall biosynthesis
MPNPFFSIIITSFNQRDFIADAVRSALSQRCQDRETIVIEDGSTDGSCELLQEFGHRIRLIKLDRNTGVIGARNAGVEAATGDFLVFPDGDDALMPWALDVYRQIIREHDPKVIVGKLRWVEKVIPDLHQDPWPVQIRLLKYKDFLSKDRSCELSASDLVVERITFRECGSWTPGTVPLEPIDVLAKLGVAGPAIQICSPETVAYRAHSANSIWNVRPFVSLAHQLLEKERHGEYPGGKDYLLKRRAWFGGQVFFWAKRGVQNGLYGPALRLIMDGYPMMLAAVQRRAMLRLTGRNCVRTEPFQQLDAPSHPAGELPSDARLEA